MLLCFTSISAMLVDCPTFLYSQGFSSRGEAWYYNMGICWSKLRLGISWGGQSGRGELWPYLFDASIFILTLMCPGMSSDRPLMHVKWNMHWNRSILRASTRDLSPSPGPGRKPFWSASEANSLSFEYTMLKGSTYAQFPGSTQMYNFDLIFCAR